MTKDQDKNIFNMTIEDFKNVPHRTLGFDEPIGAFDYIVILPTKEIHSSDFLCMEFVLCADNHAICRVGGGSDVIHIDGIAGAGNLKPDDYIDFHKKIFAVKQWAVDCLPSGLLRLYCFGRKLTCGPSFISSFELFAENLGEDKK